ncbi:MAG: hypothetical protein HYV26_12570, partial [Candidatus Hydrogenedentes bacterium]|nr:hypothetical protein [Candidatus Hydrogenedentota bacterium]
WDLRPVPEFSSAEYSYETMQQWEREGRFEDLIRVYEQPYNRPAPTKIPAGRIELSFPPERGLPSPRVAMELALSPPEATVSLDKQPQVRVWVHATEPVGMIQVSGSTPAAVQLIAPLFGGKEEGPAKPSIVAGELSQLGYPPPKLSQGEHWRAFEQEGWGGFRFAIFLMWEPGGGTEWRAAWTVATTNENHDPLALARQRVEQALKNTDEFEKSHELWWKGYWDQSRIRVPNKVIEKQWYLDTYKFGAASRRGAPPITLQGPWTADDGKLPPWKGDYHHDLNTQLSYWPCYAGNRLEEGLSYLDWLWATRENCVAWTQRFFKLPGMNVPMTGDLKNNQIGGWRQYTHSATTGAWLAHHFYLHWKFSQDRKFLEQRAYPYLNDCAVFLEAVTNERDAAGKRSLPLSSSPEINDNKPNAWFSTITNYDLALIRFVFSAAAELADMLGNAEDAAHWRSVLAELPEWSLAEDGGMLVAPNYPLNESHRHFSHLMAIHPLGLIDLSHGEEEARIVRASLAHLKETGTDYWCGYSFAWLANLAARAKDGETAAQALETFAKAFVLRNSFHCNGDQSGQGYSKFTYRPFTLEGNFAAAAGLQEMLLQSHTGVIEVFPAVPKDWREAAFERLRAQGGFLVSATRAGGETTAIVIESEYGGTCRVLLPWTGAIQEYALGAGERRILEKS